MEFMFSLYTSALEICFLVASGEIHRVAFFFFSQMAGDSSSPVANIERSLVFVSAGDRQSKWRLFR